MWAVARVKAQRPLGEWLGVTIYSFIGISANLAGVTSSSEAGTLETQYWAWGLATMIGKCAVLSRKEVRLFAPVIGIRRCASLRSQSGI